MLALTTVIQLLLILTELGLVAKAATSNQTSLSPGARPPLRPRYVLDGVSYEDRVVDSLKQVLLIHRHGDRTPISFEAADPLRAEPLWDQFGKGELLNQGKARMYHLGEVMRARYGRLLGGSVDKNKRISYSSSVLRCLESAELFLASFLRLDQAYCADCDLYRWDASIDIAQVWQPASIRSGKWHLDAMLYSGTRCQRFNKLSEKYDHSSRFLHDILPLIGTRTLFGVPIDTVWKVTNLADTTMIERSLFKDRMEPEVVRVYDGLQKAADLAFGLYQDTVELRRLRGGLLLGDMIANMEKMRDEPAKATKFMHYSTHDTILTILLGMFDSWRNERVDYSASIAVELHQVEGEWLVELLYMPSVPGQVRQLQLNGCGASSGRCPLSRFVELMQPYLYKSIKEWQEECNKPLEEPEVPYYEM